MESQESTKSPSIAYLLILKRWWVPAVSIFSITLTLSILAALLLKSSYQAEGKLLFKNSTFKVVGSNLVSSNIEGGESGELKPLVSNQNPITTQIEIISSRPLLQQTLARLKLKNDRGKPIKVIDLQTGLTFKIVGGSDVLQISCKNSNPQAAASIVNMLMNVYVENDILTNQAEVEVTRQFMDKQLPKTQIAVNKAEESLRKFKQQNNVVDLAEESRSAVGIIGNLETGITATQAQLEEVNAHSKELHQKINLTTQEAMAVSTISQSSTIQGILTQLQEVSQQLATESGRFSDNNPIIIDLKEKQSKIKTLLKQQVYATIGRQTKIPQELLRIGELKQNLIKDLLQSEVQQTGLVKKLASLQTAHAAYQKRVHVMPQLVQLQRQMERQLEVSQSTHQTLLKKVQELQLAKNKNISNARIVSSAIIPEKPDLTLKMLVGSLGILFGALFATTAIACLELRARAIKARKEVGRILPGTSLGTHPQLASEGHLGLTTTETLVRDISQSLASDIAKIIQVNLRFVGSGKILRIITIASIVANEEKSNIAAKLAVEISKLGQGVLLIDADIRNPHQHHFWKLPLNKGLSELLAGKSKFQQILWTVMNNLDILTAGTKSNHPLFGFDSEQMKSLMQEVSVLYDFVIIDTPPLLLAADVLTGGHMTDGIMTIDLKPDFYTYTPSQDSGFRI